jgi:hypothetical protein
MHKKEAIEKARQDVRARAVQAIKAKVAKLERAIDIVNEIPFGVPVHIVYANCSVGESNGPTTRQDNELVVTITSLSGSEVICILLAWEKPWWEARKIGVALDLTKVKIWKPFDKNDAGLYINWFQLTEEFKKLAFGK